MQFCRATVQGWVRFSSHEEAVGLLAAFAEEEEEGKEGKDGKDGKDCIQYVPTRSTFHVPIQYCSDWFLFLRFGLAQYLRSLAIIKNALKLRNTLQGYAVNNSCISRIRSNALGAKMSKTWQTSQSFWVWVFEQSEQSEQAEQAEQMPSTVAMTITGGVQGNWSLSERRDVGENSQ